MSDPNMTSPILNGAQRAIMGMQVVSRGPFARESENAHCARMHTVQSFGGVQVSESNVRGVPLTRAHRVIMCMQCHQQVGSRPRMHAP